MLSSSAPGQRARRPTTWSRFQTKGQYGGASSALRNDPRLENAEVSARLAATPQYLPEQPKLLDPLPAVKRSSAAHSPPGDRRSRALWESGGDRPARLAVRRAAEPLGRVAVRPPPATALGRWSPYHRWCRRGVTFPVRMIHILAVFPRSTGPTSGARNCKAMERKKALSAGARRLGALAGPPQKGGRRNSRARPLQGDIPRGRAYRPSELTFSISEMKSRKYENRRLIPLADTHRRRMPNAFKVLRPSGMSIICPHQRPSAVRRFPAWRMRK